MPDEYDSHGNASDEEFLETLFNDKQPVARELTDDEESILDSVFGKEPDPNRVKIKRMTVEARFYLQGYLMSPLRIHSPEYNHLLDLALIGLRVLSERGDAPSIIFEKDLEYPV